MSADWKGHPVNIIVQKVREANGNWTTQGTPPPVVLEVFLDTDTMADLFTNYPPNLGWSFTIYPANPDEIPG